MYFGNKGVHPSVRAMMDLHRPKQQKLTESVEQPKQLILEVEQLDKFFDVAIPLDSTHVIVLNENEEYEMIRVDEGIGDLMRKAMGFVKGLWGHAKGMLKKLGIIPQGELEKFASAYAKDPKAAIDHVQKRLADQGFDQAKIDKSVKKLRSSMNRIIAARRGVKSGQAPILTALAGAADAIKQAGGDPAAERVAIKRALSGGLMNKLGSFYGGNQGGNVPSSGGKKVQASAPAQQPEQQPVQQPVAQPAATLHGFKEGDKVHTFDAQKNPIEGVVVKTDQATVDALTKKGFNPDPLMVDVNGNKQTLTQHWKAGPAPTAQPAQAQPAQPAQQPAQVQPVQTSQQGGPNSKLPPGNIKLSGTYKDQSGKVAPIPDGIATDTEGVASLVKQYKTRKITGLIDNQEVEVDSLTADGDGMKFTMSKSGGGGQAQPAAQPAQAQPTQAQPTQAQAQPAAQQPQPVQPAIKQAPAAKIKKGKKP